MQLPPDKQLLSDPTADIGQQTTEVASAGSMTTHATIIDHYHLLQKIGEGGMGEVWLAEQKEPVRRRVAVKLIKAGMNTREVIGRFESERQALALMEHPTIAKVFDAGSTADGAPYFAMEYVAGVPITEYCDNHRLSIKERLDLFIQVCEGVRHAHQKAVIHRDLKPSNILVGELDGRPIPKIIDFGLAKALGQKLTAHTMFTRVGSLVGTPEYMSPEQALSSGEDVDTRTDVYSLGIILYELLAGGPPIELRKIAFDEYLRRLRDQDPPKPSTRIRTQDAATSTELARRRQTEPATLIKEIGGDLDSIALKALEKDRSRRYGSAEDFAADIARYLKNEAVMAVPPSPVYRARKFANRHRWGLAMACAFVVVLTAATVISIRQSVRANREAAVAEAVNDFLRNDVLAQASASTQASPSTQPDPHLEVRTALDRAAARINGQFDNQPEVEAAVQDTIGETYVELGSYSEGRTHLERALELRRRWLGARNEKTLATARRVGNVVLLQGKRPEAESLLTDTVAIDRRVLGPKNLETLGAMNNLVLVYYEEGKYPQAEKLDKEILERRSRVLGAEHRDTLASMTNLALIYRAEGKYSEAEALYSQALEVLRRVLGPDHPETLQSMNSQALVYSDEGKYEQAEKLGAEVLNIRLRVMGSDHPDTLQSMNNLAALYYQEGKYAEAEKLDKQLLESCRRVLGAEHPHTLGVMEDLASVYDDEGKSGDAEALYTQALSMRRRVSGPEHPETIRTMLNLAETYVNEGKYPESETLVNQALTVQRRTLGAEHAETLWSMNTLANAYLEEGKYPQAEALYRQVLEVRRRVLGPEHPDTIHSMMGVALAEYFQGKQAQGEEHLNQAVEISRRVLGSEHPLTLDMLSDLAFFSQLHGEYTRAEGLAKEVLTSQQRNFGGMNPTTAVSSLDLGLAYVSEGKFVDSEYLAREDLNFYQKQAPDDWHRYRAMSQLGASLAGEKKYAEAEPLLLEGYQGMLARKDRISVPDRYHLDRAHEWLIQLYVDCGKPDKAAAWRKK